MGLDWFSVATEASGDGTPDLMSSPIVLGYMDIYRRKKSVRGATRGPRGWGHAQGGRARPPPSWAAGDSSGPTLLLDGLLLVQK